MDRQEFTDIFDDRGFADWEGDNAFQGLVIINFWMPGKEIICAAEHDIIYSVDIDELIEAGITTEDVTKLANLNWTLEDDEYLACYV